MDGGHIEERSIMKIDLTADLPVLTRDYVSLCNRLASGKLDVRFRLAGKDVSLSHALSPQQNADRHATRFAVSNGKDLALARIDVPLLETLLKASDFEQDVTFWSKDTTALVLAHFLDPVLATLPTEGETWRVVPSKELALPSPSEVHFTVSSPILGEDGAVLSLVGEPAAMEHLLGLLENQIARPESMPALNIEEVLSWRSPGFLMPIGVVEKCRSGDVVLLDPSWRGHEESVVWLGQTLAAPVAFGDASAPEDDEDGSDDWLAEAQREDAFEFGREDEVDAPDATHQQAPAEGMTLGGPFKPTNPEITAYPEEMSDVSIASKNAHGLNDLSVTLSVEFDRMTKPLAELKDLDAGAVLPFDTNAPETVRLMANGKPFADGELVRIEDRIGVRLTKMA